ncbi:ATP-binding protein [Rapidithrix thailandica]|uniref:ATP-binding protein n=1 Tax=Rapidithrix thailandica TaxID=413964 RepID=A0AAW9S0Y6_9BACT
MIYKKTVSCNKVNLKALREFVLDILRQHRLSDSEANLIVVAVDEVCSNLMIHSHACNPKQEIEVHVIRKKNGFEFVIYDNGEIFNIAEYTVPNMEELIKFKRTGGIGLILVKKIMDSIRVEKKGGRNICRLFKNIAFQNA